MKRNLKIKRIVSRGRNCQKKRKKNPQIFAWIFINSLIESNDVKQKKNEKSNQVKRVDHNRQFLSTKTHTHTLKIETTTTTTTTTIAICGRDDAITTGQLRGPFAVAPIQRRPVTAPPPMARRFFTSSTLKKTKEKPSISFFLKKNYCCGTPIELGLNGKPSKTR